LSQINSWGVKNITNWSEITTFEEMLVTANSHSPFWTMILFMIWSILVITFLPFGTVIALLAGSFVGGLIGLFLVYMGLVAWKWVLGMFSLVIAIVIFQTLFAKKET
jgi:hypothetical protein